MRLYHLVVLSGAAAFAAARVLSYNSSAVDSVYRDVQTAVEYRPDNIAPDAWWDKYKAKGAHYQCLFVANNEDAGRLIEDTRNPPSAQSVWTGDMIQERATWGWFENTYDADIADFDYNQLKDACDALKLNAYPVEDGGHNKAWSLGHYDLDEVDGDDPQNQYYTAEGRKYQCTGAHYTFVVNQIDGLVWVDDIFSPHNAVKVYWRGKANPEDLPKLRYASDLIWGKWVEGNANVKNLRIYGAHNVVNDETSGLVSRAMENKGAGDLTTWPGAAFTMEDDKDDFQALIGSPIGGIISIMLVQHKAELGNKEIFQVNIVVDGFSAIDWRTKQLHMFFQIRDVPPKSPEDPAETPEVKLETLPAESQ